MSLNTVPGWREDTCKECNRRIEPVKRYKYFCDSCRMRPTRKDLVAEIEWTFDGHRVMPIAKRGLIWEAGKRKGLTYYGIGELANMSGGTLKGWDRGYAPKNLRRVSRLAFVLEVPVYKLFAPEVLMKMDRQFKTDFLQQLKDSLTSKTLPSGSWG